MRWYMGVPAASAAWKSALLQLRKSGSEVFVSTPHVCSGTCDDKGVLH